MVKTKNVSTEMKVFSIILGTLLGGFIWRCRGESGFGSSWGLYSVGIVLIMLIYLFYGKKPGMKFELIPIGALLAGLGVTGYGTVIDQLAGGVYSDVPYQGEVVFSPVNKWSGAAIILIMAITLIPLFTFFLGTLFSEKEYKLKHYIIGIIIFFGVSYILKASFAHVIMKWINPDQVNYAALGLKDAGFDYSSPFSAYMHHFGQRKWTQDIPYFENYYMSVESISDLFGIAALALYPLIAFKDKVTSGVMTFISVFTGIVSTVFTSLVSGHFGTGFFEGVELPKWFVMISDWGIWEYITGAAVGFSAMLIIALLPNRLTAQTEEDTKSMFDNKVFRYVFDLLAVIFVFGVTPARVIGIRLGKVLKNKLEISSGNTIGTVVMIVLAVIFGVFMIIMLKKNILDNDTLPLKKGPVEFSRICLPSYLVMCLFAYFILDETNIKRIEPGAITGIKTFFSVMTNKANIVSFVMIVTFILLTAIYIPVSKKLKKQ